MDFRARCAKLAAAMKSDLVVSALIFVLGALAVLGVVFALQTIFLTREFRALSTQAGIANNSLLQAQQLAHDVEVYNQKNPSPELTRVLQSIQAKTAAH